MNDCQWRLYNFLSSMLLLSMALLPLVGPWPLFQFLNLYTVGRTAWTGDQSAVARPLPTHTDNHASSGIRTRDPRVRASEDSSCLRPLGHCDQHPYYIALLFRH
jgi:hypothetical protein